VQACVGCARPAPARAWVPYPFLNVRWLAARAACLALHAATQPGRSLPHCARAPLTRACARAGKRLPGAPHQVLLVLDGTTGARPPPGRCAQPPPCRRAAPLGVARVVREPSAAAVLAAALLRMREPCRHALCTRACPHQHTQHVAARRTPARCTVVRRGCEGGTPLPAMQGSPCSIRRGVPEVTAVQGLLGVGLP
jgi:hypothetical protein